MKKAAVILTAVITAFLGGCTVYEITEATTAEESREAETTAIVVVVPDATEAIATEMSDVAVTGAGDTEETTVLPEETSAEQTTAAEEKITAGEKTTAEEKTTKKEEKTTKEDKTTANSFEEVELSISMPEKNGTMVTDDSPNNQYIKIVNKEKKINKDLLLAVYSVPESGQNYVFEFYDAENSDADRDHYFRDGSRHP